MKDQMQSPDARVFVQYIDQENQIIHDDDTIYMVYQDYYIADAKWSERHNLQTSETTNVLSVSIKKLRQHYSYAEDVEAIEEQDSAFQEHSAKLVFDS